MIEHKRVGTSSRAKDKVNELCLIYGPVGFQLIKIRHLGPMWQKCKPLPIQTGGWVDVPGVVNLDVPVLELGPDLQGCIGATAGGDVYGALTRGDEVAKGGRNL